MLLWQILNCVQTRKNEKGQRCVGQSVSKFFLLICFNRLCHRLEKNKWVTFSPAITSPIFERRMPFLRSCLVALFSLSSDLPCEGQDIWMSSLLHAVQNFIMNAHANPDPFYPLPNCEYFSQVNFSLITKAKGGEPQKHVCNKTWTCLSNAIPYTCVLLVWLIPTGCVVDRKSVV